MFDIIEESCNLADKNVDKNMENIAHLFSICAEILIINKDRI